MRVIEKIEVSKLKYGCVVVTQNFLFNYSLFKIILNPSKKVEFSSENQKDMSVDGIGNGDVTLFSNNYVILQSEGGRGSKKAKKLRSYLMYGP